MVVHPIQHFGWRPVFKQRRKGVVEEAFFKPRLHGNYVALRSGGKWALAYGSDKVAHLALGTFDSIEELDQASDLHHLKQLRSRL